MIAADYAKTCWEGAKRTWTHVNLREPRIHTEKSPDIACMDMVEKQVHIFEKTLEDKLGADKLRMVEAHEIGHHKLCPYDLHGFVRLVGHAYSVVRNMRLAKLVENLFADLIVNTSLVERGEPNVVDAYQMLSADNDSRMWQFYMSTFEHMIAKPGCITGSQPEEMTNDAKRIADIISAVKYRSQAWPGAIKDFAQLVRKYLDKDVGNAGPLPEKEARKDIINSVPKIDDQKARDFLPFKPDGSKEQAKHIEGELRGLERELDKDDYKSVVAGLGLGTKKQANLWFYRGLVSSYSVELPMAPVSSRSHQPIVPKRWRTSDPPEKLHIEYSLANFGVLIPNVTTYQLVGQRYSSAAHALGCPDLVIVMDASGSMPDPCDYLSYPVLSGMIASKAALDQGCKVAVLTFSSKEQVTALHFSRDAYAIDEALTLYYGGGTYIPAQDILALVRRNASPSHVLVITDTHIANLRSEADTLAQVLKYGRAGGTIFLDVEPDDGTKILTDMGFDVVYARSEADLAQLTLNKAKALYGGGNYGGGKNA